jgi:hypothetical protein
MQRRPTKDIHTGYSLSRRFVQMLLLNCEKECNFVEQIQRRENI